MAVHEQINLVIEEKGFTKREFAKRLITLEPKSKRTGEVMSEKAVYAYLSGKSVIDADLIPYIADALQVSEQSLFTENEKIRTRHIRYLLDSLRDKEKHVIEKFYIDTLLSKQYGSIVELLPYASESMLKKMEQSLLDMKSISERM